MVFLLDTNVISEFRKGSRCFHAVATWQKNVPENEMYVSAISLMELKLGVLRAERKDAPFARRLKIWYEDQVLPSFAERTFNVDIAVAEKCSELNMQRSRPFSDGLIAATAIVHDLTLVTRNVKDFSDTGAKLVNPWEEK